MMYILFLLVICFSKKGVSLAPSSVEIETFKKVVLNGSRGKKTERAPKPEIAPKPGKQQLMKSKQVTPVSLTVKVEGEKEQNFLPHQLKQSEDLELLEENKSVVQVEEKPELKEAYSEKKLFVKKARASARMREAIAKSEKRVRSVNQEEEAKSRIDVIIAGEKEQLHLSVIKEMQSFLPHRLKQSEFLGLPDEDISQSNNDKEIFDGQKIKKSKRRFSRKESIILKNDVLTKIDEHMPTISEIEKEAETTSQTSEVLTESSLQQPKLSRKGNRLARESIKNKEVLGEEGEFRQKVELSFPFVPSGTQTIERSYRRKGPVNFA